MVDNKLNLIKGYHYTNINNYISIKDGSRYGENGLIPIRRFIKWGDGNGLLEEAHDGIIEGLLEPEPDSWLKNSNFPHLWRYLMSDICREEKIMLLSFYILPQDKAFVVERAHVERELYKPKEQMTRESRNEAFKKYWESRVPIFLYDGSYSVPQLAIWSKIDVERLNIEWVKHHREVWQRVLDNDW